MHSPGRANATRLAHVELTAAAQRHAHLLEEHCAEQRRAYLERMKVSDVRPDIDQETTASLVELESEIVRVKRELDDSRIEWDNKLADYQRFRDTNNITREPYYREDRFRHVLLALFAILAETILNGNFLATGAQGGLVQGWTLALGISFINVGGAFCGGSLARLVNDRTWTRRTIGFLSIATCACILILFNLLVAHYREALLASQGYTETLQSGKQAWTAFSENYVGVSDFMSWMLFALGMMSAGIGAWKGYSMEDPYPGYSRLARALRVSEAECKYNLEDALGKFKKIQKEVTSGIDQYVNDYRLRLSTAQSLSSSLADLPSRLRSEREKLLNSLLVLHAKYCPEEKMIELAPVLRRTDLPNSNNIPVDDVVEYAQKRQARITQRCKEVLNTLNNPNPDRDHVESKNGTI